MENIKVSALINHDKQYRAEYTLLRSYIQAFELEEEVKWGQPTYCLKGKNVVLMHGFKNYCALLFIKGALINDKYHKLIQQTDSVQAARQLRFKSVQEISDQKEVIIDYIQQAITNEGKGLEVELKKTTEYETVDELIKTFEKDGSYKEAFYKLTPGRQRAYLLYFAQAKQNSTRLNRIDKVRDKVFDGKGPTE